MGATDFTSICVGETAEFAFREAQSKARFDHGNSGYTGTCAEKSGYYFFEIPERLDPIKLMGWVSEYDYVGWVDGDSEHDELKRLRDLAQSAKPGTKRAAQAQVRQYEKQIKEETKEREKLKRTIGKHLSLVKSMASIWGDKWGPAVCFEITSPTQKKKFIEECSLSIKRGQKVYVFFGVASC